MAIPNPRWRESAPLGRFEVRLEVAVEEGELEVLELELEPEPEPELDFEVGPAVGELPGAELVELDAPERETEPPARILGQKLALNSCSSL